MSVKLSLVRDRTARPSPSGLHVSPIPKIHNSLVKYIYIYVFYIHDGCSLLTAKNISLYSTYIKGVAFDPIDSSKVQTLLLTPCLIYPPFPQNIPSHTREESLIASTPHGPLLRLMGHCYISYMHFKNPLCISKILSSLWLS